MTSTGLLDDYPAALVTPFSGQVVAFTGKLFSLGRKEAQVLVERLGGVSADEVTARTTVLVVGAEGFARAPSRDAPSDGADKSQKLRKAEQANARQPGSVQILTEEEFCRLGGLPSPETLCQQFYGVREIRELYPAVREDRLRYLEQWSLIRLATRTNADRYYRFSDLSVIKQINAELERGTPFRAAIRALVAERDGQLAFDFQPARGGDSQAAKVVAIKRRPPRPPEVLGVAPGPLDAQLALAAKYFLEGAALDEGDQGALDAAMTAYRKALMLDPNLVPALVNLANCHYARDQLAEAQALYERALGLDAECFEAHYNLGNIRHDLGRLEEAEVCYRDALVLNPNYPDAHFYLAVTLEKMRRSSEAKPHWRAYQSLAPDGEWVELAKEFSE